MGISELYAVTRKPAVMTVQKTLQFRLKHTGTRSTLNFIIQYLKNYLSTQTITNKAYLAHSF